MMDSRERVFRPSASRMTVVAHFLGIAAVVLLLIWLLHYREGIDYYSDDSNQVFNTHPFLMVFGLILFSGEALMAYKTVPADRRTQKFLHMFLNLIAFCLGVFGIRAAFKFHDMTNVEHMNSLHSWIGIGTISTFALQWLFGFITYMVGEMSYERRAKFLPWHISGGRTIFYMAICAALTGLMRKLTFMNLQNEREARVANLTGISILIFGIFVDLSVALARYV